MNPLLFHQPSSKSSVEFVVSMVTANEMISGTGQGIHWCHPLCFMLKHSASGVL